MTSETRVQHWHVVESGDGGATIKSESGGYVGTIQWKGDAHKIAREHNSHADLLAALVYMVSCAEAEGWSEFMLADAQTAIKQARGE